MATISLLPDTGAFQNIVALEGGGFVVFKTGEPNSVMLFEPDGAGFAQVGSDINVPTAGVIPKSIVALPGGGFALYFVQVDNSTPTPVRTLTVATYDDLGVQTHLTKAADPADAQFFTNARAITTGFSGGVEQHWVSNGITSAGLSLIGLDGTSGLATGQDTVLDAWDPVPVSGPYGVFGLDGGAVVGVGFVVPKLQLFSDRPGSIAPAPTFLYDGQPFAGSSPVMAAGNCLVFETLAGTGSGADFTVTRTLSVVAPDDPTIVTTAISRPGTSVFLSYAPIEGFGFAVVAQFISSATRKVTGAQIQFYDERGNMWGSEDFTDFNGVSSMAFEVAALDRAGNNDVLHTVVTWRQEMNGPGNGFSMLAHVFDFSHFTRQIGTTESDLIRGFGDQDDVTGEGGNDLIQGFGGNDGLDGAAGNDTVDGGDGNDGVDGGAGNDRLLGGDGHDTMNGEEDDDQLLGGLGDDLMSGGDGDDHVEGGIGIDKLHGDAGNDDLIGGASRDRLFGDAGDDNMTGGVGSDVLFGGTGNDSMFGDDGDDDFSGGAGDDLIFGDAGIDKLRGEAGNDDLTGDAGNDLLLGGAGDDELDGGAGNDTLQGNDGADILTGGTGGDQFVFLRPNEFEVGDVTDLITDFSAAEGDKIDLSAIDARTDRAGNNAFRAVADFTGRSGELRLQVTDNGLAVEADRNGDKVVDFTFFVQGALSLQQSDFLL